MAPSTNQACTLSGFQRSFQRHLHAGKGSLINILNDNADNEFFKSREVLTAKQKNLVRQGKGNRPNAKREPTEAEEDVLFEDGQFGVQDPKSLQRALWWFLSLHFGWRAQDESRKPCWGDVGLANDPETDSEYVRFGKHICSGTHYLPQKFGVNHEDKQAFSLAKGHLKLSQHLGLL